jgi:hypothetical protein
MRPTCVEILEPQAGPTVSLADFQQAYAEVAKGGLVGKVVITLE